MTDIAACGLRYAVNLHLSASLGVLCGRAGGAPFCCPPLEPILSYCTMHDPQSLIAVALHSSFRLVRASGEETRRWLLAALLTSKSAVTTADVWAYGNLQQPLADSYGRTLRRKRSRANRIPTFTRATTLLARASVLGPACLPSSSLPTSPFTGLIISLSGLVLPATRSCLCLPARSY